ncbi:MAG TPA: hypothetical protein VLJ39_06540, partial [Tepidisphaeraceae bacterium]|nr:hypothetical protein [Tepidisphaeraceae bacterium]
GEAVRFVEAMTHASESHGIRFTIAVLPPASSASVTRFRKSSLSQNVRATLDRCRRAWRAIAFWADGMVRGDLWIMSDYPKLRVPRDAERMGR